MFSSPYDIALPCRVRATCRDIYADDTADMVDTPSDALQDAIEDALFSPRVFTAVYLSASERTPRFSPAP